MRTIVYLLVVALALTAAAGLATAHEDDDAKVTVDSTDYYYCVGGWGTNVHTHAGPVSASVDVCHPPLWHID